MRVCHCATCVAIATALTLPSPDHPLHQPHTDNPSPREQVTFFGRAEIVSSNGTSAARTASVPAPEARHAAHLR